MKISQEFINNLRAFHRKKLSPLFFYELSSFNIPFQEKKEQTLLPNDFKEIECILLNIKKQTDLELEKMLKNIPEIHPLKTPYTLFSPMGYDTWEVAYTKTLAFLLSNSVESGSHLFKSIIKTIVDQSGLVYNISNIQIKEVTAEKNLQKSKNEGFYGRADIIANFSFTNDKRGILFIEAKIDANEGDSQLERYEQYLQDNYSDYDQVFKVFLTKKKKKSLTNTEDWVNLSFKDILNSIEEVIPKVSNEFEKVYLAFFASSILKDILDIHPLRIKSQSSKYATFVYLKQRGEMI